MKIALQWDNSITGYPFRARCAVDTVFSVVDYGPGWPGLDLQGAALET
ncbi:hypothetical protein [Tabrizicola sp.]